MTNDPRYSQTRPPGRQPATHCQLPPGPPGPTGPQSSGAYGQQHYDWRYATEQQRQAFRAQYDPYRGAPMLGGPGQYLRPDLPAGPQRQPRKLSRATALTAGAVAVAIVSAGVGGGVAVLTHPSHGVAGMSTSGAAPGMPAASAPAGSIEQVAAKVASAPAQPSAGRRAPAPLRPTTGLRRPAHRTLLQSQAMGYRRRGVLCVQLMIVEQLTIKLPWAVRP